jgi:hypothetical protein
VRPKKKNSEIKKPRVIRRRYLMPKVKEIKRVKRLGLKRHSKNCLGLMMLMERVRRSLRHSVTVRRMAKAKLKRKRREKEMPREKGSLKNLH